MAVSELSIDVIHQYFIEKGGLVANREVVKHFKNYLTNPTTKDEARSRFKKYINTLAIAKIEGDEKFLMLRPQYATNLETSLPSYYDTVNSVGIPLSPSHSLYESTSSPSNSPRNRLPPPYRPPPPPPPLASPSLSFDNISICSNMSIQDNVLPEAPPRRKSTTEKTRTEEMASNVSDKKSENPERNQTDETESDGQECDKQPVSVKERTQKFNRMASVEDELSPRSAKDKKKQDKGVDEDDSASVSSLDQKKCTEWLVTAAKGEYQELAKLASDEPRLVKLKDPFTAYTVLHWGAKHGNEDIIKLFAGKYKVDANSKTNGGYTPLHMAVQFGHKKVYNLLIEVYKADPNIRDFSGRKPDQYEASQMQVSNKDAIYKNKSRKKMSEKDLRFLRIGSLNVRVKKTTEVFSNFLGVGGSSNVSPIDALSEKLHKSWGSADNLSQDRSMPAPKGYIRRKTKKSLDYSGTNSTPGTPRAIRPIVKRNSAQDLDSDSAAGFDSQWQH